MENEVEDYNDVQGLIQHAMDQDFNKANKIFGDIMTVKMNDLLDQEQIRLADQIYNGADPDEDEQLEMDFDDDDIDTAADEVLDDDEDLEEYEFGTDEEDDEDYDDEDED